jgi:glycosyltransferase involved in cell wall biosynthesis
VQSGQNGLVFEPGNATSLLDVLRGAWAQPDLLEKLGRDARQAFEAHYNEDANHQTLLEIYEQAMVENRRSRA